MTTNGYLLTPEVFERLLKLEVYNYQITIDGVQENHDKYRTLKNGAPTFEKIIDNLQNISKNIKSNAFKIAIRANITKESFEHIDEFMDLMYKEFHHDKRFTVFLGQLVIGERRVKLIKSNLLEKENALFSKLLTYKNSGEFAFDTYESLLNAGSLLCCNPQ
ncbi:MAG: radical SAM protein [Ruminococcus sp.]